MKIEVLPQRSHQVLVVNIHFYLIKVRKLQSGKPWPNMAVASGERGVRARAPLESQRLASVIAS